MQPRQPSQKQFRLPRHLGGAGGGGTRRAMTLEAGQRKRSAGGDEKKGRHSRRKPRRAEVPGGAAPMRQLSQQRRAQAFRPLGHRWRPQASRNTHPLATSPVGEGDSCAMPRGRNHGECGSSKAAACIPCRHTTAATRVRLGEEQKGKGAGGSGLSVARPPRKESYSRRAPRPAERPSRNAASQLALGGKRTPTPPTLLTRRRSAYQRGAPPDQSHHQATQRPSGDAPGRFRARRQSLQEKAPGWRWATGHGGRNASESISRGRRSR